MGAAHSSAVVVAAVAACYGQTRREDWADCLYEQCVVRGRGAGFVQGEGAEVILRQLVHDEVVVRHMAKRFLSDESSQQPSHKSSFAEVLWLVRDVSVRFEV